MKKPETKFKKRVMSDLEKLEKVWTLKTQEVGRRGVPDLIICLLGDFIAIELKDTGQEASPLQSHTLGKITHSGGWAFVADPETWDLQYSIIRARYEKLLAERTREVTRAARTPLPSRPSPA